MRGRSSRSLRRSTRTWGDRISGSRGATRGMTTAAAAISAWAETSAATAATGPDRSAAVARHRRSCQAAGSMGYTTQETANLRLVRAVYEQVLGPLDSSRVDELFAADY